jgi:hypothetical protein
MPVAKVPAAVIAHKALTKLLLMKNLLVYLSLIYLGSDNNASMLRRFIVHQQSRQTHKIMNVCSSRGAELAHNPAFYQIDKQSHQLTDFRALVLKFILRSGSARHETTDVFRCYQSRTLLSEWDILMRQIVIAAATTIISVGAVLSAAGAADLYTTPPPPPAAEAFPPADLPWLRPHRPR